MTDAVKEQLSACLDGELPQTELDLLLKRLGREGELRDSLGRYALIGEALRVDKPVAASRNFATNVMAAIENEPAVARPAVRIPPALMNRLRPVVGMAVAAGVAAIAVFSVQRVGVAPEMVASEDAAPSAVAPVVLDGPSYIVPTTTSNASFVPATRLTNYVVAHSEYSSPLGRRSMLSGVLAEDDAEPATVAVTREPPQGATSTAVADEAANVGADVPAQSPPQER